MVLGKRLIQTVEDERIALVGAWQKYAPPTTGVPFFIDSPGVIAGSGKSTILCVSSTWLMFGILISRISSTIIQDIDNMRAAGLAMLAFYYFDSWESKKQDLYGLLSFFFFFFFEFKFIVCSLSHWTYYESGTCAGLMIIVGSK